MQHYNIRIAGRVQGVGFRHTAKKMAVSCHIRGFVKNEYDGADYIEAEGEEANLRQFIRWCRNGPASGRVTDISVEPGELKDFKSFSIRF